MNNYIESEPANSDGNSPLVLTEKTHEKVNVTTPIEKGTSIHLQDFNENKIMDKSNDKTLADLK